MKKLTICMLLTIMLCVTGCSKERQVESAEPPKDRDLYYLIYNNVTANLIEHNITSVDIEALPEEKLAEIKTKAEEYKEYIIETLKLAYPDDWEEHLRNYYKSEEKLYDTELSRLVLEYITNTYAKEPLPDVGDFEMRDNYYKLTTQALNDFRKESGVVERLIKDDEVIFDEDTKNYYDLSGIAAYGKCVDEECIDTEYERIDLSQYEVRRIEDEVVEDKETNEHLAPLYEKPIDGCKNTLADLNYTVGTGIIYINGVLKYYISIDDYFWLVSLSETGIVEEYRDVGYLDKEVEHNNASLVGVLGERCFENGEW